MATTFAFYTDAGLTTPQAPNNLVAEELVDGSTGPVDFLLYWGSTNAARTAQDFDTPGVDQVQAEIVNTITVFVPSGSVALNAYRVPTVGNGFKYKATIGGIAAGSEPIWPTTVGLTVVSGGVTFTCEKVHPITEVKLAATSGGLAGAAGGASLNLGTQVLGGVAGAKPIHIRVQDTTLTLGTSAELRVRIRAKEYDV